MKVADLHSATMLAMHMSALAFRELLGGDALWSDVTVRHEKYLDDTSTIGSIMVNLIGGLIQVPGTQHLYRAYVAVHLISRPEGGSRFQELTMHLHHPRMGEWDEENEETFVGDLQPGINTMTMFTTKQEEVDDPKSSYTHLLPALTSLSPKAEPQEYCTRDLSPAEYKH